MAFFKDCTQYRTVETDNTTYDLTFEDIGDKIVVYVYSQETYETEVYDVFKNAKRPGLSEEDNFIKNVDDYIKDNFE